MTPDLPPYPAYKPSGIPWLGEIPAHWEVRNLGSLLQRVRERNRPDLPLLSVVREKGVILRSLMSDDENHNYIPDDLSNYRVVRCGNLVINKMKSWQGSLGISNHDGIVSPAYFVFECAFENRDFLHRLLRSKAYVAFFAQASDGIRVDQWDLSIDRMKRIPVLVPPLPEQHAIARYLDYSDRRIRRYIRAKQKLIGLLNEQKQAIIQQAVTRGLDPTVRLKPSGVEWLGDVPEHWDSSPAKYFYREVDNRSKDGVEELLSVSHLTGVTPRSQKNITMFMAATYVGHKICESGDLVINTMWAWMGALGVTRHTGIVSPSYAVYRPLHNSSLLGEYADVLLRTRPYIDEYVCRSTGVRSSRLRLYPEQFLRMAIVCPPLHEQRSILEHISVATNGINVSIDHAQREISLLREYRTRLIADVVTGKVDVRAAAAWLPDEDTECEEEVGSEEGEIDENDPDVDSIEEEGRNG